MPRFSQTSRSRLDTCHEDLQTLFNVVIKTRDCTIIEGHRTRETQDELYSRGRDSKGNIVDRRKVVTFAKWPQSRHNTYPSDAVDVLPYHAEEPHLRWDDRDDMEDFSKFVIATADRLFDDGTISHRIRWGADWDRDGIRVDLDPDEHFFDGPHYELVKA